ncbi:MAG: HD family phosphohydrolase [Bacillota bacterium]
MLKFEDIKQWLQNKGKGISLKPGVRRLLWGLLFLIIISLILTIDLIPNRIDLEAGQVSKTDITAPRTITFVDKEETRELEQQAAQSAPKVYEEDNSVNNNIKTDIKTLFELVREKKEILNDEPSISSRADLSQPPFERAGESAEPEEDVQSLTPAELAEQIQGEIDYNLSIETLTTLLTAGKERLDRLESRVIELMDKQLQTRILPEDLETVRGELERKAMALELTGDYRLALAEILKNYVKPNMRLNEEATDKKRQEMINQVEAVEQTVRQGEIILRKGDVVTEEDIKILEALGLQKPQINYLNIFGVLIMIISLLLLGAYYLKHYQPEIWNDNKKLLFLELMILLVVILAKIASVFQDPHLNYLVPVAMASILITILINSQIAIIVTVFISFLMAMVFGNFFSAALVSFIGGLVGIYSVSRLSQRSDLVRAGFNVSGVLVILITGLTMTDPVEGWTGFLTPLGIGVLNGILVAIFANGLLPYLESIFDLTSSVKLLELSNPSQPLLKRLLVEAPGTYHHSVIVGNLAETAADNIGANSLLTRVAAYYHDIGKLKRPYFFTENQFGGDNPHDKISANLSALIIKSHVKDGVEIASKYKLPQDVIDILEQHHGKNLLSHFYQEAIDDSKHDNVEENEFRYDGPKPYSKEAAIIMLADVVEAAIRSKNFNKNNHNRIELMVRDLIKEKLIQNQLDQSELTLRDLDQVADSFVKVLSGIYHHRVEYPENLLKEMKRADDSDKS